MSNINLLLSLTKHYYTSNITCSKISSYSLAPDVVGTFFWAKLEDNLSSYKNKNNKRAIVGDYIHMPTYHTGHWTSGGSLSTFFLEKS